MSEEDLEIPTADGAMPTFLAGPDGGSRGAIVLVHEAFGVTDHIRDVARRLATAGYCTVAPALYHRTGSPVIGYDNVGATGLHVAEVTDAAAIVDLAAAVGFLGERGFAPSAVGVVGFCLGGRLAFLAGLELPIGAAVTFYGAGIASKARIFPGPELLGRAKELRAPWLGLFGDLDPLVPPEDAATLAVVVPEASPHPAEVVRYPDAGHGFHRDHQHGYHEASAVDAWQRTLGWLDDHLEQTRDA